MYCVSVYDWLTVCVECVCVSQAETEQTGLGVWKRGSEARRPARLRSSHHSSITCPVYCFCVNLELCVCVYTQLMFGWQMVEALTPRRVLTEHHMHILFVPPFVRGCVCCWMLKTSLHMLWWRGGSFLGWGLCLYACGGCWRMYGQQLWRASRQAFPSRFPALLCFFLNGPLLLSMEGKQEKCSRPPVADWED